MKDRFWTLVELGQYVEAERHLRQVLVSDPEDAMTLRNLAYCVALQNQFKDALKIIQKSLGLDPEDSFSHFAHAYILIHVNRMTAAHRAILEAIRLAPQHADYYGTLSNILFAKREFSEALRVAEMGLSIDPNNEVCLARRAIALAHLGRSGEAIASADRSVGIDGDDSILHANRGFVSLRNMDHDEARLSFREALRIDPNNEWAREGMLEAMRAKSRAFRVILRGFFWLNSIPAAFRNIIVYSVILFPRLASSVSRANPNLRPILAPIAAIFIAVWIVFAGARPLMDVFLSFSEEGRLMLSKYTTLMARVFVFFFALTAVTASVGYFGHLSLQKAAAITSLFAAIISFICMGMETRWVQILCSTIVSLVGGIAIVLAVLGIFIR